MWADYYSNPENIEKIVNFCKYREVVIIKRLPEKNMALRPFKIFKPEHLEYWIRRLNLTRIKFDLYISNASIKLPPLPSDLRQLKEARAILNQKWREWLNGEDAGFVTGFDVFADIDIEQLSHRPKAREYAMVLAGELRKKGYNPKVWDTSRGFHVIVVGKFRPDTAYNLVSEICNSKQIPTSMSFRCNQCDKLFYKKDEDVCPYCGSKDILPVNKPFVDLSVTGDIRRIRRCPYSLHSKTGQPMEMIGWM